MSTETNPYAPPKHDGPASTVNTALEAIRREHINAETNVKTIGALCYLGAASSVYQGVKQLEINPIAGLVTIVLGAGYAAAGHWLRQLDPQGRKVYAVLTVLGFLSSVIFNHLLDAQIAIVLVAIAWPLLLLGILWMPKSSTVMTRHYREVVIPATPHIKHTTSVLVIVLGLILIVGLIGLVVSAL